MPEISRWESGLVIRMYYDEGAHALAHFHALLRGDEASIAIETGEVLAGTLDRAALRELEAWRQQHRAELLENWERMRRGEAPIKIR